MTDHKSMPVAGYTDQSDDNVKRANELKYAYERIRRELEAMREQFGRDERSRSVALAVTALEESEMWAVRAVFNPQRPSLPEDPQ